LPVIGQAPWHLLHPVGTCCEGVTILAIQTTSNTMPTAFSCSLRKTVHGQRTAQRAGVGRSGTRAGVQAQLQWQAGTLDSMLHTPQTMPACWQLRPSSHLQFSADALACCLHRQPLGAAVHQVHGQPRLALCQAAGSCSTLLLQRLAGVQIPLSRPAGNLSHTLLLGLSSARPPLLTLAGASSQAVH
jgi:hypothetical protein